MALLHGYQLCMGQVAGYGLLMRPQPSLSPPVEFNHGYAAATASSVLIGSFVFFFLPRLSVSSSFSCGIRISWEKIHYCSRRELNCVTFFFSTFVVILQAGNDDDDAALAAGQVIEAVSTVLQSTKSIPELFPTMEAHLMPMLVQANMEFEPFFYLHFEFCPLLCCSHWYG